MPLLLQADKNDDYLLPKQLDVNVARLHLLVFRCQVLEALTASGKEGQG